VFAKKRLLALVHAHMWAHAGFFVNVHAYFFTRGCMRFLECEIYKERWALISFSDIGMPAYHYTCGQTLTTAPGPLPTPISLPYYPLAKHPLCHLSQATTIGGETPVLDHKRATLVIKIEARRRRLCLSSFLPKSYVMLQQDLTPGLTHMQQPCAPQHLPFNSLPTTHLHERTICFLAINCLSAMYR